MKKAIFFLVLIVTSIEIVSAKQTIHTCEYYKPYDQLSSSEQAGVLCEIYDDYSHQCYMEVGSNKATTSSNKESIQNWGSAIGLDWRARDYVKNNNKCPDYLLIKIDSGINGYEIHAVEDQQSMLDLQSKLEGQRYFATLNGVGISSETIKKAEEEIKSYTETINRVIDNYSLESCMKSEVTITKLSDCEKILFNLKTNIYTWDINVFNWINEGYFKEEDAVIQEYRKATERANNFQETAGKELEEEDKKIKDQLGLPGGDAEYDGSINFGTGTLDGKKLFGGEFGKFLKKTYNLIKFAVPIIIIAMSIIDFIKATVSQDQKEINKAASKLVKRLAIGVLIFVLPTILEFLFKIASVDSGLYGIGKS